MQIGSKIFYFDIIDSTNDYAKTLINEAPDGTIVFADQQSNGKGRCGKTWYSPKGGIWMSVLMRPVNMALVSTAAGVAVCAALHTYGIVPGVKWPNDILLNGKKIGGILTEIIDHVVVVGIGLNLNVRSFPDELRECASSVFAETKKHLNKKMVFDLLCKELDDCYIMLNTKQDEAILNKWRDYTVLLGQGVMIDIGERSIEGRVINIDRDGRLIVMKTDGEIEHVNAGVCHLKQKQSRDA